MFYTTNTKYYKHTQNLKLLYLVLQILVYAVFVHIMNNTPGCFIFSNILILAKVYDTYLLITLDIFFLISPLLLQNSLWNCINPPFLGTPSSGECALDSTVATSL